MRLLAILVDDAGNDGPASGDVDDAAGDDVDDVATDANTEIVFWSRNTHMHTLNLALRSASSLTLVFYSHGPFILQLHIIS